MARRRARYPGNAIDTDPVIRLWLLRILIALGGHREFVRSHGFNNDALAEKRRTLLEALARLPA